VLRLPEQASLFTPITRAIFKRYSDGEYSAENQPEAPKAFSGTLYEEQVPLLWARWHWQQSGLAKSQPQSPLPFDPYLYVYAKSNLRQSVSGLVVLLC